MKKAIVQFHRRYLSMIIYFGYGLGFFGGKFEGIGDGICRNFSLEFRFRIDLFVRKASFFV